MQCYSPAESEEQKAKLMLLLRRGLPDTVNITWVDGNLVFKEKTTAKTILTARYDYPPYPNSDADIEQLIQNVVSRLNQAG